MGLILFNGVPSQDYGIQVEHLPGYVTPERDYEIVHVPGRNGDVVVDKGSFKNVTRKYEVSLGSDDGTFVKLANDLSNWLYGVSGYSRLEDSYEPDFYRKAIYVDSTEITNIYGKAARAVITFECKPQRFLKSGEIKQKIINGSVLNNPTKYDAKPLIYISGSGTVKLSIGDYEITISKSGQWTMTIDCDLEDAYNGTTNMNPYLKLNNGVFPKIKMGENRVSYVGTVTSLEIAPNWWTL